MDDIRSSVNKGDFYPLDRGELLLAIDQYILNSSAAVSGRDYKALIVPHSGYRLAGEVMASAYKQIRNKKLDEIFIISSPVFHKTEKCAVARFREWQTALGSVEQSHRTEKIISSDDSKALDIFVENNDIYHNELGVEVQLPFLQQMLKSDFRIVPMCVNKVNPRILAAGLDQFIDQSDLIVITAELSQGYPADYGQEIDKSAVSAILECDVDAVSDEGFKSTNQYGIAALLELARRRNWKIEILDYRFHTEDDEKLGSKSHGLAAFGLY